MPIHGGETKAKHWFGLVAAIAVAVWVANQIPSWIAKITGPKVG